MIEYIRYWGHMWLQAIVLLITWFFSLIGHWILDWPSGARHPIICNSGDELSGNCFPIRVGPGPNKFILSIPPALKWRAICRRLPLSFPNGMLGLRYYKSGPSESKSYSYIWHAQCVEELGRVVCVTSPALTSYDNLYLEYDTAFPGFVFGKLDITRLQEA